MAVDDALAVVGQDGGVAALDEALAPLAVGVVFDCQCAHDRSRTFVASLEVGLFADEVGGFDLGAGQPSFDRVVLAFEFGAHESVALLDPTAYGVHAGAGWAQTVIGTRSCDRFPHRGPIVPRNVDFPAGIAHVADAEDVHVDTSNRDAAHGTVRRAFLAEVSIGELAKDGRGVRAPQADRYVVFGAVGVGH